MRSVDGRIAIEIGLLIAATGGEFTAVLAFDDLTALGVVRGLNEAGKRVPEDCSVVGFDDILPAALAMPALTTICQLLREMGLLATQHMLMALEQPQAAAAHKSRLHMLAPELVVRGSSAAAKSAEAGRNGRMTGC